MDITGLEEDAVATALFDAQWDEQRAIELLLEEAEQLTAWEETGPKKKKNKNKQAADESAKVTNYIVSFHHVSKISDCLASFLINLSLKIVT